MASFMKKSLTVSSYLHQCKRVGHKGCMPLSRSRQQGFKLCRAGSLNTISLCVDYQPTRFKELSKDLKAGADEKNQCQQRESFPRGAIGWEAE